MLIESLHIDNFRCIERCKIKLAPNINCIVGDNASGKTTLLEGVYILGRGNSFRQPRLSKVIRNGGKSSTLRSTLKSAAGRQHRLAVQINDRGARFKLDGAADVHRYDLISVLPLQLIDPNLHRLLEQGPRFRRTYLDWGVFHVEHAFFPAWRRYRRALRQRNRALRTRQPKHQVVAWDPELVQQGEVIDACRRRFIQQVEKNLPRIARRMFGNDDLHLEYRSGWRGADGFGVALAQSLERDLQAGFTQQGPHRADMRLSVSRKEIQGWISRGQQKILSAALLLAQVQILRDKRGIRPIVLMDDMSAELGAIFQRALFQELTQLNVQCLLTFLNCDLIPSDLAHGRVFHVEHGCIRSDSSNPI